MIEKIIELSLKNKLLIFFATLFLIVGSIWSLKHAPLDALPDLSPPQVIVQINYKGQSPQTVEEQGTYPLVSQFLSIADIETVRGYSTYENGLIYIIFKEGVDLYWARSRVLEQLASIQNKLPKNMNVALGPDASGVGWVYEYALSSDTKNLAELRSLQDYYYKFALMGVDGVSEVASIGGFIPTFEVSIKNSNLVKYELSINEIVKVLKSNNNDTGGRIVIKDGYEWMVQAKGYINNLEDIRKLPVAMKDGIPLTLGDIGEVHKVPAARRGVADLDGKGEVVGGIVLVRYGEDVYTVLQNIKAKMKELQVTDVNVTTVYDRSALIDGALDTLKETLIEESIIVIFVIGLFLLHLRSALIVLFILPLTVGITFLLMKLFGISSNIMSLGGIAIAIGTMVDASIVMIENAHKMLQKFQNEYGKTPNKTEQLSIILESSKKVGRPIFFALSLIIVSFLPIFALSNQEGLLFTPLAFTKTFTMAVGALLSISLVPVLILLFVKGEIKQETHNPINKFFIWLYNPILQIAFKFKYAVIFLLFIAMATIYPLYSSLKWEFMPMLNEQTYMYMPVTPYGISIDQSKALTQKTDMLIKTIPEVDHVFGKGGRADTATDPAPLGMLESIITFKDPSLWPEGVSYESLRDELDQLLQIPGLTNSWTYPIRGRIDMLLSGIRTPVGIKLYGKDSQGLQKYAKEIEQQLREYKNTSSVIADQAGTGYYLYIDLKEDQLQRYNISKDQVLEYVSFGIGGLSLSTLYKGLQRYPITLRLDENDRTTLEGIKNIQLKTPLGFVPLNILADVSYKQNISVVKSELAKLVTFIYITPKEGVSAKEYVQGAKELLTKVQLPEGYYIEFAGQSQYLDRAMEKIVWIIPLVLLSIFVLIYLALRKIVPSIIVFFTLPFALLGGILYMQMLDFSMSIAVIVGFLALLGVAAETAIVMIVYLQEAVDDAQQKYKENFGIKELNDAVYKGAVQRVRPKLMTVFSILAGLAPIMYTNGIGSEVMQRIAAPMLGGIVSSAILSLLIIPLLYEFYVKWEMKR